MPILMNAEGEVAADFAAFTSYGRIVMGRQLAIWKPRALYSARLQLLFRRQLLRQSSEERYTSGMEPQVRYAYVDFIQRDRFLQSQCFKVASGIRRTGCIRSFARRPCVDYQYYSVRCAGPDIDPSQSRLAQV